MFKIGRQIAGIALGVGLLGAGTTAQASVPQDALVVGGIEYGASENYVRSVYGAPHKVETKYNPFYSGGQAVEWEYGSGFDITFVDGAARRIEIDARNGIQTKENIAVGTDVNTLIAGMIISTLRMATRRLVLPLKLRIIVSTRSRWA